MNDYIYTIEELSLNAWPSHKMEMYDGWLLRFSHNYTHRTNCVNIISPSKIALSDKVLFCENEYRNEKTPCIFKISPLTNPEIDSYLDKQQYKIEHTTEVMTMPLSCFHPYLGHTKLETEAETLVQVTDIITDDWIHNLFHLNGTMDPIHRKIVPAMFKAIPKKTIVVRIEDNQKMIASGLGILDRDHIGLYAIYVDAQYRKRSLGNMICSRIIQEAMRHGASRAYLQVVEGNHTARKLYEGLGFQYLYTYWFRSKPVL
ncbi:GNAT family N-acetyltransferase [Anaeromicropila populeti]|uniref:Acetyltransferase (GNAT) family protein n=1 Tax=Anaeromicropila populeti TaxID=37658 RepID=A0A1I6LCJ6_9FIRM|nr:GNAT family N-acetyltransferase [Anaeromicropila populeti]SFS00998.1 Acetyltransferase (GNAT) family protein [Anaeromicropila populeti]